MQKKLFFILLNLNLSLNLLYAISPPSTITNLASQTGTIDGNLALTWSAPGNDGSTGMANYYVIKHSTNVSFDWANSWSSASVWKSSRAVAGTYGTTESETVTGLLPMVTYYFCIKTVNSQDMLSGLSNITTGIASGIFFNVITLSETYNTYRLAVGDYNNDGYLEFALANSAQVNRIYRNNGNNTFTMTIGLSYTDDTWNVAWGDYDNDGFLDLAVGNGNATADKPNRIYHNNQDGSFTAVWSSTETSFASNVAWSDYDNDGYLDLAISNFGQPTQIYHNNGNNVFSLSWTATKVGVAYDSARSVAWGDYDNDGYSDFVLGNQGEPNRVYRNNGDGSFSLIWSSTENDDTWSVAWADYDNDGYLDIGVGNDNQPCRIYRNNGNNTFSLMWSSVETAFTRNIAWGDYNNDGLLDIALANSAQTNRVYRNNGDSTFALDWTSAGSDNSWGIAWGDYDNDGDLDLVTAGYGTNNRVYQSNVNIAKKVNTSPQPPSESSMSSLYITSATMSTFQWGNGTDTETSVNGLYYNIRITTFSVGTQTIYASAITLRQGSPLLGNYLRPKLNNNQLGIKIRNLPVEKIYYWSVQTIDSGLKTSSWSTEKSIIVANPPSTVTDLSFLPGSSIGEIKLLWTSPGDDGTISQIVNGKYRVAYSTYPTYPFQINEYQLQVTTTANPSVRQILSVTGLLPTVTYYFHLWIADEVPCWSEISNQTTGLATATLPPPPTNIVITQNGNDIYLQWAPAYVAGTLSYRIYCDNISPADNFYLIDTSSVTSYIHRNLTSGNTYFYKITTILTDIVFLESDYSVTVSTCLLVVLPVKPTNFYGRAESTSTITWLWRDNANNETGYRVFSDTAGQVSPNLSANTTFWLETRLSANSLYYRYVTAYNTSGQVTSASSALYTLANIPKNTQINKVDYQSLTLIWTQGDGGNTQYKVEMAVGGVAPVQWSIIVKWTDNLTEPTTTVANLSPETTYWFRVSGYNGDAATTSQDVTVSTMTLPIPPGAPTNFGGVVLSTTSIHWTWVDNDDKESGFRVRELGGSIVANLAANATYWIETGLLPNTSYYRYVQVWNPGGYINSLSTAVYTLANIPGNLLAYNITNSELTLSWYGNGSRYRIERAADTVGTKNWLTDGVTPDQTSMFRDRGLQAESTYWYRICAYNGNGLITDPSGETKFFTGPHPATALTGTTISTTSIRWIWNDNTNAEYGYRIVSSSNIPLAQLLANTTIWIETGLESNVKYSRYVEVYNGIGTSSGSVANRYTFATIPTNLQSLYTTYNTASLSWAGNGSRYGIERSADNLSFVSITENCMLKTYTDTGLIPLTTYYYRVRAFNGDAYPTEPCVAISTLTADVPPSIVGKIYDSDGKILDGVKIVVSSVGVQQCAVAYTNKLGYYEIRYIPDGNYSLKATKDGYTTDIRSNVTVKVLYTATVDFVLTKVSQNDVILYDNVVNLSQGGSLTIGYYLVQPSQTKIQVYSINGQTIANLLDENKQPGSYLITWSGKDEQSQEVGSGIYMIVMQTNSGKKIKKVVVVK